MAKMRKMTKDSHGENIAEHKNSEQGKIYFGAKVF